MFADGAVPNVEVGEAMAQVASDILTEALPEDRCGSSSASSPSRTWTPTRPWATRLAGAAMKISFVNSGGKTYGQDEPNYGNG